MAVSNRSAASTAREVAARQIDFTEAGELVLFINESQLAFLGDTVWEQDFVDSNRTAGTFRTLSSNELIWLRMVREYMMGDRAAVMGLMAWNVDATRMPFRMHSEYLQRLFSNSGVTEGRPPISRSHSRTFVLRSSRPAPRATTSCRCVLPTRLVS